MVTTYSQYEVKPAPPVKAKALVYDEMKDPQVTKYLGQEYVSRDCIDFKKIYVDMVDGDVLAGLMLSSIMFWYIPTKRTKRNKLRFKKYGYKWIVSSYKDWWERCRLSEERARRAMKVLVDKGLIVKQVHRFKGTPTTYFRIVWDKFLARWNEELAKIDAVVDEDYDDDEEAECEANDE
jgi:hypothetical protein